MRKKHVIKKRVRKFICLRRAGPAQKTMLISYEKNSRYINWFIGLVCISEAIRTISEAPA